MKPDLLQFEGEYAGKIKVVKVDVRNPNSEEYKQFADLCNSQYIPHLVLIDASRKILGTHTGSMTKEDLIKFTGVK